MSIKALSMVASGAALLVGGLTYMSTASAAVNPISLSPVSGVTATRTSAPVAARPARPPARSLFRPGPRNPVGTLE